MQSTDFLVLGSGIGGLVFALHAARAGTVRVLTKREPAAGSTAYAQGGIAAAVGSDDSPEYHAQDTLVCGAGICDPEAVRMVTEAGPHAIARLAEWGVAFSPGPDGQLGLGREGGHSRRRVVHASDATGQVIMKALLEAARRDPRIEILDEHCGVDLILEGKGAEPRSSRRCRGVYALDAAKRRIEAYGARVVVLATGGTGKAYRYTSNPDVATGDGVAMAYRAGCRVANLEFVQFHPTCLYHPEAKDFLITEAVRGEGGFLTNLAGERLEIGHPQADLAPRDVVARAIDRSMKRRGEQSVHLHIEHLQADWIRQRFPTIYQRCLELAIDVTAQPIPVVPAAHYQCGGVMTDLDGRTDIPGLFALGEVAYTGLHGANRLASNSLLEGVVLGERTATAAIESASATRPAGNLPPWDAGHAVIPRENVLIGAHWDLVRTLMWEFVGIVRNDHRLELAAKYLETFRRSIESYYWDFVLDRDLVELRNLGLVAELIVHSARRRKESRGLHYNEDHPEPDDGAFAAPTVLDPLQHEDPPPATGHGAPVRP